MYPYMTLLMTVSVCRPSQQIDFFVNFLINVNSHLLNLIVKYFTRKIPKCFLFSKL